MSRYVDIRIRQTGVALITVLLVFALATMLAAEMMRSSYLAIQRTGNLIDSVQARYYALGAEELARQILSDDAKPAGAVGSVDYLGEEWARKGLNFDLDEGKLELEVEDQAGRFNLNSLVDDKGKADPKAVARFAVLLQQVNLNSALAEQVADWVDADEVTSRGAQENSAYGVKSIPNQPFADISELKALPKFSNEAWDDLRDLVSALPPGTLININTAKTQVVIAYAGLARKSDVERFVHARDQQPIKSAQDPVLSGLLGTATGQVDTKSDFFLVRTHAQYRGRHVRLETALHRDPKSGESSIITRSDAAKL